jgi:hypothetical protein
MPSLPVASFKNVHEMIFASSLKNVVPHTPGKVDHRKKLWGQVFIFGVLENKEALQ